jgi:glyoxylase-like metal-dependent hydrolase (beta-lactamase superfamily II)
MHDATLSRRTMFKAAGLGAAAVVTGNTYAATLSGKPMPLIDDAPKSNAGKQGAGFYRFSVGTIEGTVLTAGSFTIPNPHPTIAPEASKEDFVKAMEGALHPADKASLEINPTVFKIGSELVLVDSGGDNLRAVDNLRAAGVKPEQITAVIITHAHGDHIGGTLTKDGSPVYPNAKVFLGKAEHDFWTGPADMPNSRMPVDNRKGMADGAKKWIASMKGRLELVKPGDKILSGLEIVDGSGHTPGHLCISVTSGSEKVFLLADLVHHPVAMFHNPDWTIGFDADPKAAATARKRIFPMLASDKARVLAYHLPWPGFGRVGKHGDAYWWAPEAWNWGE